MEPPIRPARRGMRVACALAIAAGLGLAAASPASAYADRLDLRDRGVVTPVKNQNPWGTCWSFSATSASEVSLLSDLQTTYAETPVDLSELHLAWYSYTALPLDDDSGQGGEGIVSLAKGINGTNRLNSGGEMLYATSLYSSGIGVVNESSAPYQNAAGTTDKDGDWSLNEDEVSRFSQVVEFEESNLLPTPYDDKTDVYDGSKEMFDTYVAAFKSELEEGRGISIGFYADQSRPGQVTEAAFMNPTTWSHYTYDESVGTNHGVTVVGYDDEYPASKFAEGFEGEEAAKHTPEGDGAWIVKNSWGEDWGLDGYFYLSYYDKTICAAETFDFDVTSLDNPESYYINQYDYIPSVSQEKYYDDTLMKMANVFTAEADQTIRALSCETYEPNMKVTFEVYLLGEDEQEPASDATPIIAYTTPEAYEYAGYHRVNLDEDSFYTVKQGQRFAVVVTQRCLDDGKYYAGIDTGKTEKLVKEEMAEETEQFKEQYRDIFYEQAKEKMPDATEEEIWAAVEERLDEIIEENGLVANHYWVGVVHDGESLIYSGGAWSDLNEFTAEEPAFDTVNYTYDNFAIKAYADIAGEPLPDTEATEESVLELRQGIEAVRKDAESVSVSADGKDVSTDNFWVTQAEMDALMAAVEAAEKTLESYEYPTQEAVDAAADNLEAARRAFDDAKKPGTKQTEEEQDDTKKPSAKPGKGDLPQTGDSAIIAVATAGIIGASAVAGGIVLSHKRRKQD